MNKTAKILAVLLVIIAVACAAFVFRPAQKAPAPAPAPAAPETTPDAPQTEPAGDTSDSAGAVQPEETLTETWAEIWVDNRVVCEINLNIVQDQTLSLEERTGKHINMEIKDHAIRFASSDCPDQICVHSGYQRRDLDIASCLPNRVVVTVEERTVENK